MSHRPNKPRKPKKHKPLPNGKFGTPGAFGNPLLTPARRRELKMLRQVAGMSASQVQAELNKQS